MFAAAAALAGCGGDRRQAHLCAQVIGAVESRSGAVEILEASAIDDIAGGVGVGVRYRLPAATDRVLEARCRFAGQGLDRDRLVLARVETETQGVLSDARLHMARVWLGLFSAQIARTLPPPEPLVHGGPTWLLYLMQQTVNGLVPGVLYALIAAAVTLVWGLIHRIALIFGQLAMLGAYGGVLLVTLTLMLGAYSLPVALASAFWLSITVAAVYARVAERLVVRPTLRHDGQATLIATVGVAIALQEFVRLAQGSRDHWLQPLYASPHPILGNGQMIVSVSTAQIAVLSIFLVLALGVALLLGRTGFGRAYRACCDDPGMAALVGVPTGQVSNGTFLVAGALAAAAGFIAALYYGGVNAYMGVMLGFKGLTAAVLGGIGSVPGALIGGLTLGLFESLWDAYLALAWRDVAVFGVLALVLIFRPGGLLGREAPRSV